ncbi:nucleophosmin 1a [Thalassophryne amazonica]|uniref:nucleophosmin 1a n=1 Tax=Thalassophryne amazonica TaxID=390379 RepID=UPI001471F27F|nr:nucleophosmin 1a [Thalassophryne amazonica]
MNGLNDERMAAQTFLYGCVLEAGKEAEFNPEEDDFEHQLDLRMACVDSNTKDELHVVEVEGHNPEGQKIKTALVSLKPSTLPSVCLGGFAVTPPIVFRLKAGSGPIHISGQHLIMLEAESFDEEEEEEEEEEVEEAKTSKKRPAASPSAKPQKKKKIDYDEDDGDDDEDDDDDDDEEEEDDDDGDEEDDEDDMSEEDESPVKAKPSKSQTQNAKSPKPTTPGPKEGKTPKGKTDKSPKTPVTPKAVLSVDEIKTTMMERVKKGVALPKVQPKFENLVKHCYKITGAKEIAELWKWRQTIKDAK